MIGVKHLAGGFGFAQALRDEGVAMPPETTDVEIFLPVDGVVALRFTCIVLEEDLPKVGRALIRQAGLSK